MMIPNGYSVLHSGDEIVAVCENDNRKRLLKVLTKNDNFANHPTFAGWFLLSKN